MRKVATRFAVAAAIVGTALVAAVPAYAGVVWGS